MDEREYNRQTTKLEFGSKTVLCTPWEDAGKMDAVTFQATSAATSALMTTFLSVQTLRRKLEHAYHVLQECHVGTEIGIAESIASGVKSGTPLWETHLTIASDQTSVVLENIRNGLDEMIKKFSSALRSVEPVLVLRSAREQVQKEIQRPFEKRCGPGCGTAEPTTSDVAASMPSTSPRVPVLPPSRPWSSNSLSARVASAISRAGSTKETVQLLLESSEKRRIAEIAERHIQAQAESPSPRPNRPERTRVQVIKRTKKEAQTLLEKFDVASVTPSPKILVRDALHDDGKAVESPGVGEKPRAEVVPKRVAVTIPVPPVAASSAAYGAKLAQALMSIDQKASAVLMLKADRNLYRTLSVEERQIVLEHEKHEQVYHHNHAILNMKIVGAQFSLKKLKRETPGSNLEKETEKSLSLLEHQKRLLEEERTRQVKLTCIELARHKRHLPQV